MHSDPQRREAAEPAPPFVEARPRAPTVSDHTLPSVAGRRPYTAGSTLPPVSIARIAKSRGQVLVETAIIMPIMIFVVLGAVQLMLIAHARVMTEYAAYCAARAGIVHNGNWNVMQNAAMVAALPLYARTDDAQHFIIAWAKVKGAAEATQAIDQTMGTVERMLGDLIGVEISGIAPDVSIIKVRVTSPTGDDFAAYRAWIQDRQDAAAARDPYGTLAYPDNAREIDFDDLEFLAEHPSAGRLGIELRVLFPLKIPLVNAIMFNLWYAQAYLKVKRVESTIQEWAEFRGRMKGGQGNNRYLDQALDAQPGEGALDASLWTSQWSREVRVLREVASRSHVYLLPIFATYAMQMQSNMFEKNRREPVWFTIE